MCRELRRQFCGKQIEEGEASALGSKGVNESVRERLCVVCVSVCARSCAGEERECVGDSK